MDEASASIEAERPKNVAGRRRAIAEADPAGGDLLVAIATRSAEPQSEHSGESRLRPARIRGGVAARVAPNRAPTRRRVAASRQNGGEQDPKSRQSRWKEIDKVIDFGPGEAEGLEPRRPVADHAVGGVDRLIADAARQPAQREPESR